MPQLNQIRVFDLCVDVTAHLESWALIQPTETVAANK